MCGTEQRFKDIQPRTSFQMSHFMLQDIYIHIHTYVYKIVRARYVAFIKINIYSFAINKEDI